MAYIDKYGVEFSDDLKTLVRCPKDFQGEYTIPSSVARIGECAFEGCFRMTDVIIPDSVICIEDGAFMGCKGLKSIVIPDSITNIGEVAFAYCYQPVIIVAHTHAVNTGDYCSGITSVILHNSVTHIGEGAFTGCKGLKEIRIPKGQYARFAEMDGLKDFRDILVEEDAESKVWEEVARENIPEDILAMIEYVEVRVKKDIHNDENNYDDRLALEAHIKKRREPIYWPLSTRSELKEGDKVDPASIELIVFSCEGEDDIYCYDAKALSNEKVSTSQPKYLFFDTETAGLPHNYNAPIKDSDNWPRLVQLAWLLVDEDGIELKRKSAIIYPEGFNIPDEASEVHGITTERAKREGWPLRLVLEEFMKDLESAEKIVGHNVDFDLHIVCAELYRLGLDYDSLFKKSSICTMKNSMNFCAIPNPNSYYGGYKWPTLQELYLKLFNRNFDDAHDALSDILATKECYFELESRNKNQIL